MHVATNFVYLHEVNSSNERINISSVTKTNECTEIK